MTFGDGDSLTVEDAAKLCRVSAETFRQWIQREGLPCAGGPGPEARVDRTSLAGFLASHGIWTPPELVEKPPLSVLVADDEADTRKMLARMVLRLLPSARVHEAADGFEAGQQVMSVEPDLVILDVHLPGADGVQVCRRIRSCAGFGHVRILAISGDKDPALKESLMREGADAFLAKPFYPKDLEDSLAPLLAR